MKHTNYCFVLAVAETCLFQVLADLSPVVIIIIPLNYLIVFLPHTAISSDAGYLTFYSPVYLLFLHFTESGTYI